MRRWRSCVLWAVFWTAPVAAQTVLDKAYTALREQQWARAVELFERGLASWPDHPTARKDLAYTLLRLGDNEAARDQFQAAWLIHPGDEMAALEFAFLAHDTGRRGEARRIFQQLQASADAQVRATAERAFQQIDGALAESIARWQRALEEHPEADTVHEELARLAEQRGLLELAETHYLAAFRLKPVKRHFLLDLGRVRSLLGRTEEAWAAYWAAYQSADVRTSERAREHLPSPVSPRVLALARALEPPRQLRTPEDRPGVTALAMAERSFQLGYLPDAQRYFESALESDPANGHIQLRLGQLANLRGDDRAAYRWFAAAKKSPDPTTAQEAQQLWRNLRDTEASLRPTVWVQPLVSSRWRSAFAYGQTKLTFRPRWRGWRAYASLRFAGDAGNSAAPAPLSERAVSPALGVESRWGRLGTAWFEGGANAGTTRGGDLRGGWMWSRSYGARLAEESGAFARLEAGANYASRFGHNVLLSLRPRWGYVWGRWELGWLASWSRDTRSEFWGNFFETGPALRVRLPDVLQGLTVQVEWVGGHHYAGRGNPGPPGYRDLRIGFWYAITH